MPSTHIRRSSALRIVFAGTPEPAVPSLRALLASEHEVVAVITRPAARSGRGRTLTPSPVAQVAAEFGISTLTPISARDPEFLQQLTELAPDAGAVVAYGALLPQAVLDVPANGWVNLHFSLLPAWRGAAPVYAAIKHGDEVTGASTFRLEAGLDTGPVFGTVTETIEPADTAGDLLGRLSRSGAILLVRTMDGIADGSLRALDQLTDGVSHVGKVSVAQAEIDWQKPAFAVDRDIRALTPEPGAWTSFRGARIGIGVVRQLPAGTLPLPALDGAPTPKAGELVVSKQAVFVGTAAGCIQLGLVKPAGKKPMPAADWARGARVTSGERFDSNVESDTLVSERRTAPVVAGQELPLSPEGAVPSSNNSNEAKA